MDKKTMMHLIELVDDLIGLDDALKNLTGMGYHERFPRLAYVYDVIKQDSIFRDTDDDDKIAVFFELVEDNNMTPEERTKKLMGIE